MKYNTGNVQLNFSVPEIYLYNILVQRQEGELNREYEFNGTEIFLFFFQWKFLLIRV